MKKIVIIGATSAIALECAKLWIKEPSELILVVRNHEKGLAIAGDLQVRSPRSLINIVTINFIEPESISTTIDNLCDKGVPDYVLIAHGNLPNQGGCEEVPRDCCDALIINGISPALFAEAFSRRMEKVNKGVIGVIGSVAGDRARKSNYVYGAAKCMLSSYIEGMQHRLYGTKVKIVLIKPGPINTPMTANLKKNINNMASPSSIAPLILSAMYRGKPVVYVPSKWRFIMFVVKVLPSFIFNRTNF